MNPIKEIKSWFTKDQATSTTIGYFEVTMSLAMLESSVLEGVSKEIVNKISEKYLEEHAEEIKKKILDNPNFASAVYNAIVLKVAKEEIK